jgi:hypothetical protein
MSHASSITSLYISYFGRPADPEGLRFWVDYLTAHNGVLANVIAAFEASSESKIRFGEHSPEALVTAIYQQVLGRTPEPEGLAFWTGLLASGRMTTAEAAFSIISAAQGADADLVSARHKAATDFTNLIDARGSGYAGSEAAEVGRALVSSISASLSDGDIARVVDAAAALSDVITTHPSVLTALIGSGRLPDLFGTMRGAADPAALMEVLGKLAELGAADPAGLQSFLRGGDVSQMLNALPSTVTLLDLFEALDAGGLSSAAGLVYPPAPVTPVVPNVTIAFESVSSHQDDLRPGDAVTNAQIVDVRFGISGALNGGSFQYSVDDGASWHAVSVVGNMLTVGGIDLTNGTAGAGGLITDLKLRVLDKSGNAVLSFSQELVHDNASPAGTLSFERIGSGAQGDPTTDTNSADVKFKLSDHDPNDVHVQWRFKGDTGWIDVSTLAGDGGFTLEGIDLSASDRTIELRVIDAAGNAGTTQEWTIFGPPTSITSFVFKLSGNPSIIELVADKGNVVVATGGGAEAGLVTKTGLTLSDLKTGTAQATGVNYMDGSQFGLLNDTKLRFDQTLDLGFYRLAWTDDTFQSTRGTVQAGELLFAGGLTNQLGTEGFEVDSIETLTADLDSPDTDNINRAYVHNSSDARKLFAGGGRDVIIDTGGVLDIGYRTIPTTGSDIIFGFDAGSDIIRFHGAAAAAVDRIGNKTLEWAHSDSTAVKADVTASTEAVSYVKTGWVVDSNDSYDQALLVTSLNNGIDLTGFGAGGNLLILARDTSGSTGMLMLFTDSDNDKQFDAGEVKAIATFSGGVPLMGDILLS